MTKKTRRAKARRALLALSLVLVTMMVTVGGTIAWLTASTQEVKNVFTPSDIQITLTESQNLDLEMVPGKTITKDPKATVLAVSEACWLFVKVEKSSNYDTFMDGYTMATGWTALPGVAGVYYRDVADTNAVQEFQVLAGNQVKVKTSVTKAQMNDLTEANYPTLTFTAYAVQKDNVTDVATAWSIANPTT